MKSNEFHKIYRTYGKNKTSSDRSFGIVFALVFLFLSVLQVFAARLELAAVLVAFSIIFILLALFYPTVLHPLNKVWTAFGFLLHKITNPIIMGFIFFFVCTPTGILMKLCGKDPLNRTFDPSTESYWIKRELNRTHEESMKQQF